MAKLLDHYVNRHELAALLGVSWRTVYRYEEERDGLPSVMIGRRKMYNLDSVKEWLGRRERGRNPSRSRRAA